MDLNRLEGTVKDLAGRAEQAYGEAAGDAKRESRGYARQAEGRVQSAYGQTIDQVRDAACEVSRAVERNPLGAVLVAGAVGYVLALLTRR
ncbi:CsbD family protein [Schauerella aestuarii]|jgi:uncharacterized protein YjbJ (UPF0337 family)|uniref:CsbD family protein n=1 Tax=Schauerella aestuarii TaxID=2511204 RepID=UPI0013718280|nr:CsbD family protein [Achromobacter aestuarii]MYZ44109.1 CsbD family protein [Achromobacter aestuarii]